MLSTVPPRIASRAPLKVPPLKVAFLETKIYAPPFAMKLLTTPPLA